MKAIGTRVRTHCGSPKNPYWEYGTITAIDDAMYKVEWDNGGYDYQCDFELEEV